MITSNENPYIEHIHKGETKVKSEDEEQEKKKFSIKRLKGWMLQAFVNDLLDFSLLFNRKCI
jgi:hypothetical protein